MLVLLLKLYTTTISDSFSSNSGIFVHFIYSVGKCLPRINHFSGLQLLLTRWWPICIVMRDLFSMFISTSANFSAIPPVCTKIDLYLLIQEYHKRGLSEPQRNRYVVQSSAERKSGTPCHISSVHTCALCTWVQNHKTVLKGWPKASYMAK